MATRSPATKQRPSAAGALFGSHSTMGACMQTFEWSTSAVGPVADWPASLRMAVSLCLNSQFPTVIFWGPDLLMLYNDAYLPMLADKHPASLGQISTPQIERKHLTECIKKSGITQPGQLPPSENLDTSDGKWRIARCSGS